MCTVTYIPPTKESGFILTSNRDERIQRKTISPRIFEIEGKNLCFPMDSLSGGSWIATSDAGRLCCLLNGGLEPHQKQPFHTYSRGKVLLDFVSTSEDISEFFRVMDLGNVEPFTIITIEHEQGSPRHFSESLWDGDKKHYRKLDSQQPYIWSSVTLYKFEQQVSRKVWFHKFIQEFYPNITPQKALNFHSGTHTVDRSTNVLMEREGGLRTVSITQVTPHEERQRMKYLDLFEDQIHEIEL